SSPGACAVDPLGIRVCCLDGRATPQAALSRPRVNETRARDFFRASRLGDMAPSLDAPIEHLLLPSLSRKAHDKVQGRPFLAESLGWPISPAGAMESDDALSIRHRSAGLPERALRCAEGPGGQPLGAVGAALRCSTPSSP